MYIKTTFGAFEWDEAKAEANFRKHGLRFIEAIRIFEYPVSTIIDTRKYYGETREISIGLLAGTLVTTVVHTQRNQTKRIISARPSNRNERKRFAAFDKSRH